ncbi:pinensin family lanthipeptide [Roseivirga sp. BDSF3-8]
MKLDQLAVKSFKTDVNAKEVKGGWYSDWSEWDTNGECPIWV